MIKQNSRLKSAIRANPYYKILKNSFLVRTSCLSFLGLVPWWPVPCHGSSWCWNYKRSLTVCSRPALLPGFPARKEYKPPGTDNYKWTWRISYRNSWSTDVMVPGIYSLPVRISCPRSSGTRAPGRGRAPVSRTSRWAGRTPRSCCGSPQGWTRFLEIVYDLTPMVRIIQIYSWT